MPSRIAVTETDSKAVLAAYGIPVVPTQIAVTAADAIAATGEAVSRALQSFDGVSGDVLRTQRREKFLGIGRNL